MNTIALLNPRPPLEPGLEVGTVKVVRFTPTKLALQFISPDGQDGITVEMPDEVLDKLAISVVQFIQSEAVKANREKKS